MKENNGNKKERKHVISLANAQNHKSYVQFGVPFFKL